MKNILTSFICLILLFVSADLCFGQEEEQEPEYAIITIFDVPRQDRGPVISYMVEYVIPYSRLNPNVVTFRALDHAYGSDASTIVFYQEVMEIDAECGQPCEDYREKHPAPEEGEEGYEEFTKKRRLFTKYYSDHRDEIFNIHQVKTQGKNIDPVGPQDEDN